MTEISEAAKAKADEIFGTTSDRMVLHGRVAAFIQEASDAAAETLDYVTANTPGCSHAVQQRLAPFILPEPVDPLLVEAREIASRDERLVTHIYAALRRGMELAQEQQP